MPPLPGVLTGILNPSGGQMAASMGRSTSRNRMLASAERENWPDWLRKQYGLPGRSPGTIGPPPAPVLSGVSQQYPLLNALMAGGDLGQGLRNVGSGAAMARIAPTPQQAVAATVPGFLRTL